MKHDTVNSKLFYEFKTIIIVMLLSLDGLQDDFGIAENGKQVHLSSKVSFPNHQSRELQPASRLAFVRLIQLGCSGR